MSNVRHIKITEDDDGQRFERWVKKNLPEIPYVLAQKLIRKGQFRIDGKRAKADTRLVAGQEIRVPPVQRSNSPSAKKRRLSEDDLKFIRNLVIYDDGDIIALNKPSGVPVQGGTKTRFHIDGLLDGLKDEKGVRPRLVHRLDRDTSGVLLLARSAQVARELGFAFKGRNIKKIYWAITAPAPEAEEGTIKAPLAKSGGKNKERMQVDEEEGKIAITEYRVVEQAHDKAAFVAFWPRTGRTHQIRVHAEVIGCPIIGDPKYRGNIDFSFDPNEQEKFNESTSGIRGFDALADRLHLHAHRIICKHPMKKGKLDISAPLPPELKKSWKALGFSSSYKGDPFADLDQ